MEAENITKKCTKCGEEKELEAFNNRKTSKDGKRSQCRSCEQEYRDANKEETNKKARAYAKANPEKIRDRVKAWRAANPEKMKEISRNYYAANPEKIRDRVKAWSAANPEKIKEINRNQYLSNREEILAKKKAENREHPEKMRAKAKAWRAANPDYKKNRYAANPKFRMQEILRSAMQRWKLGSTVDMIGISFDEFAAMYGTGEGMHLDHKIPMSWFDIDNADHNKVCQHHSNLQWLSPEDNLSKSDSYADVAGTKILRKDFDLESYVQDKLKEI